jgi:hypothetical protein
VADEQPPRALRPPQRVEQEVGRRARLLERVLDLGLACPAGGEPATAGGVVADRAALHLDHEDSAAWVGDDEVGLALARPAAVARHEPGDVVNTTSSSGVESRSNSKSRASAGLSHAGETASGIIRAIAEV